MPISEHSQPVHTLTCDNATCSSVETTAMDGDGYTRYFDTPADARSWGETNGWDTPFSGPMLCPADAAEARDQEHHQAEINAAINHALDSRSL
ncbi:hypothetical protein ACFY3G_02865 [Streptomyces phaeochromogenes]|uniref:hypothetical protein n=1 Tax=Streptomyces phaeochromogenes TaxID=1923 RepID=UPI003676D03D